MNPSPTITDALGQMITIGDLVMCYSDLNTDLDGFTVKTAHLDNSKMAHVMAFYKNCAASCFMSGREVLWSKGAIAKIPQELQVMAI